MDERKWEKEMAEKKKEEKIRKEGWGVGTGNVRS